MAIKFFALLLFVCAAQAQLAGYFTKPVNAAAQTLHLQMQDLEKVTGPASQFHEQMQKIREAFQNNVPARFHEYAQKGREMIRNVWQEIQKMPEQVPQQYFDYERTVQCVRASEPALINLSHLAQNLLQESMQKLVEDIQKEMVPLANDIEARTEEAVKAIQTTADEVRALIEEGKFWQARERLNAGRRELDADVTEIVQDVQEMRGDYPHLAAEAEALGRNFYEQTYKGAQALYDEVKKCIQDGPQVGSPDESEDEPQEELPEEPLDELPEEPQN